LRGLPIAEGRAQPALFPPLGAAALLVCVSVSAVIGAARIWLRRVGSASTPPRCIVIDARLMARRGMGASWRSVAQAMPGFGPLCSEFESETCAGRDGGSRPPASSPAGTAGCTSSNLALRRLWSSSPSLAPTRGVRRLTERRPPPESLLVSCVTECYNADSHQRAGITCGVEYPKISRQSKLFLAGRETVVNRCKHPAGLRSVTVNNLNGTFP
jgi:hypothetical protein